MIAMDSMDLSTKCVHADSSVSSDVTVPLHVSTTFKYPQNFNEHAASLKGYLPPTEQPPDFHLYSRYSTETRDRVEQVLGALESGFAVTYSSGVAAIFALLQYIQPKAIILSREGYYGTHNSIAVYGRNRDLKIMYLEECDADDIRAVPDGLFWLETPLNPRGEVSDVGYYASLIQSGVTLAVDATLAPPPLQNYLSHGGHSDLLGGVLATRDENIYKDLLEDRKCLGAVMGNMEAWLLLRSLRTLKVRVLQQSSTAEFLALWLASQSEPCLQIIQKVWHASIPENKGHTVSKKQGNGWSGVLSIEFTTLHHARLVATNLALFVNATSLGGCESLIEWRFAVDPKSSPCLCRLSIGLENHLDLQADLRSGFLNVGAMLQ